MSQDKHDQQVDTSENEQGETETFQHSWRLWCIFIVLCLLSFISAVDATIVTTSLPTITREIGGSHDYVWIANSFLFASTVPQPLYGQISNIFGRRNPMLVSIALFALGSGLAGGATNSAMLIAARTIQGLGTGGLYVLSDIIICDIIPPRYRGPYLSAVLSTAAIGTTIGPIIGGALALSNWRWIFWLNLPISAVGLFAISLLLNVKYTRCPTWLSALARVDFLGNAIFIPSMVAIFFGLIMGGTPGYPWASWRIILPLVLGVVGWVAFHFHQASPICREPSTPPRLFKHRTSIGGFIIIFLGAVILQAINYFLPIYFQAVKGVSPLVSGVYFLPFALAIIPFGGLTGLFMSKTGLYIPLHWLGFALSAIGVGLYSILNEVSSDAAWIGFQIIASGGTGIIFTATLPSTLAPLPESDVSVATGTYSFVRSFGLVWGVTMASIVFNGQVDVRVDASATPVVHSVLADGGAYAYAATIGGEGAGAAAFRLLPEAVRAEIIDVYVQALRVVWLVVVAVSCLGFLITFLEKHVELRKDHSTEYGLVEEESKTTRLEDGR
ncbi:Major facilitator superfamily (MFS) profile domain-containing protein [Madurella fahalii]|uniref:Major facilitator superfamily (MFS) profile domain-containing protein n=1 Tax=Madurella fahalii TaxID=1157608 RepID=A0ABQ0GL60_9PEZI